MSVKKFGKTAICLSQFFMLGAIVLYNQPGIAIMSPVNSINVEAFHSAQLREQDSGVSRDYQRGFVIPENPQGESFVSPEFTIVTDSQKLAEEAAREKAEFLDKITAEDVWTTPISAPYRLTSQWGYREEIPSINRPAGHHGGIDLAAPEGTEINAIASGVVIHSQWSEGRAGGTISILHKTAEGYYISQYLHIWEKDLIAEVGDFVQQGEQIARVGNAGASTDSHLHLEIREVTASLVDEENLSESIEQIDIWKVKDINPKPFLSGKGLNL